MSNDEKELHHCDFKNLFILITKDSYTVGQLATTIEKNGCYGWDRFGRFRKSTLTQQPELAVIANNALDALAKYREFELSAHLPHAPEQSAVVDFYEDELQQLKRFGWNNSDLPDSEAYTGPQEPNIDKGKPKVTATKILRALLHLAGLTKHYNGNLAHSSIAKIVSAYDSCEKAPTAETISKFFQKFGIFTENKATKTKG